jgi:regulator of replication initiation timing
MSYDGVLALTLVVRDEEDILAANLDFHLAQGVDVILVIDHGSSDATPEILREYESRGQVRAFRDEDRAHDQSARVQRLLGVAAREHQADWVIHCDADEFWMPTAGSLRDVFAAVPDRFGYMVVRRSNFVAVAEEDGRPFWQRLRIRETQSQNLRGDPLEPKVAQRPAAGDRVAPGNHGLIDPTMEEAPDIGAVEVLHFPSRSFAQFERKVLATGIGYELLEGREAGVGIDQLALLERQRQGELAAVYAEQLLDDAAIEQGLASGALVVDERVAAVLGGRAAARRDAFEVRRMLGEAWQRLGALADEAQAAHARIDELRQEVLALGDEHHTLTMQREELRRALDDERAETRRREADLVARLQAQEGELARLQRESTELAGTLQVIQNSAIMRATAPVRRVYYRVRSALRA